MSDVKKTHTEPPQAHVTVVYLGPVAPHWDLRSDFGDRESLRSSTGECMHD